MNRPPLPPTGGECAKRVCTRTRRIGSRTGSRGCGATTRLRAGRTSSGRLPHGTSCSRTTRWWTG
nr:MAG TPA: hypothetical protein [Caudoviricetes sp.]